MTRVYYQKQGKGTDVYASGTVEGRREWMNLAPYVQVMPHGQSELEESVPVGTSIPIYLFPDMKGRSRVRVYQEVPTAESYHRAAMSALRNGLGCLAICGGILFLLLRLRAMCFAEERKRVRRHGLVCARDPTTASLWFSRFVRLPRGCWRPAC